MTRYCDGNYKICGDTTVCETCGRRWDTNENPDLTNYPPNCPIDEEFAQDRADENRWRIVGRLIMLVCAIIMITGLLSLCAPFLK